MARRLLRCLGVNDDCTYRVATANGGCSLGNARGFREREPGVVAVTQRLSPAYSRHRSITIGRRDGKWTRQQDRPDASFVVIGNGMAGCRALEELLARDPDRYDVTIFGAEPRVNYNRIMLSPVLAGEKRFDDIVINDDAWYARQRHQAAHGRARRRDRPRASDGAHRGRHGRALRQAADRHRLGPVPHCRCRAPTLPGVVTFRDLDDVDAMLAAAATGRRRGGDRRRAARARGGGWARRQAA